MTLYGIDIWACALIFARVGAMLMLLPGIGEPGVPARLRLTMALMFTVLLVPSVSANAPAQPEDLRAMANMLGAELAIGLMLGMAARLVVSALATAGQIVGMETGLAFAQTADPTMAGAGQVLAVFLSLLGLVMIFATDLHHLFLMGVVGSYQQFQVGVWPDGGDAAALAVRLVGQSFLIAVQITAPLIAAGLIFRLGLGVLSRLIPTIQVFFVAMPLNLMGGLMIMALTLSAGMLVWLDGVERYARSVAGG